MANNPGNSNRDSGRREENAGSRSNMGQQKNQSSPQQNQSSQKQPAKSSGGASAHNLRLQLTPEQSQQIRKATGRDASSLELSVEDIEDSLGESTGSMDESSSSSSSSSRAETSVDDDYEDEPAGGKRNENEF